MGIEQRYVSQARDFEPNAKLLDDFMISCPVELVDDGDVARRLEAVKRKYPGLEIRGAGGRHELELSLLRRRELRANRAAFRRVTVGHALGQIVRATPFLLGTPTITVDRVMFNRDDNTRGVMVTVLPQQESADSLHEAREQMRSALEECAAPDAPVKWAPYPLDVTLAYSPGGSAVLADTIRTVEGALPFDIRILQSTVVHDYLEYERLQR